MTTTQATKTPNPDMKPPPAASSKLAKAKSRRTRRQVVMLATVLALLSAASLIMLLTMTGSEVSADEADVTVLSQRDVTSALLRTGTGPGSMELEALYTPSWYFQWSGRTAPTTDGTPTFGFFLFETTHIEDLPPDSPETGVRSRTTALSNARNSADQSM